MANDLRITVTQPALVWEDPLANRSHLKQLLDQGRPTDVVVLPEMFTTGFSMAADKLAESHPGSSAEWLLEMARAFDALFIGSIITLADGRYYNRLYAAHPSGLLQHYDKRHLFRLAHEEQTYTGGLDKLIVSYKGWRILPLVCYDLRFPVWSRNGLMNPATAYDLLLYVANWPAARSHHWRRLLPARAIENMSYLAASNRVGTDGKGHTYSGDSVILDYQGEALATQEPGQEGLLHHTLSHAALAEYRERFAFWQDADSFQLG